MVGTLLSTGIVGGLCWLLSRSLELGLTPHQCLLFGALISPTDPIAVLGMLIVARCSAVMTYFVVVFSVLVQGLSMKPLLRLYVAASGKDGSPNPPS